MECRGSEAGKALLAQASISWPKRSTAADGMCPSADHTAANPTSWHEPNADGISRAVDLTHDPAAGCDCAAISESIRKARDRRARRVIFKGRQFRCYASGAVPPYSWMPYGGRNDHAGHMHIDLLHLGDSATWPGVPGGRETAVSDKTSLYLITGIRTAVQIDNLMKRLRTAGLGDSVVSSQATYLVFAASSADIDAVMKAARAAGASDVTSKPWSYIDTRQEAMLPLLRAAVAGGGLSALVKEE